MATSEPVEIPKCLLSTRITPGDGKCLEQKKASQICAGCPVAPKRIGLDIDAGTYLKLSTLSERDGHSLKSDLERVIHLFANGELRMPEGYCHES